MAEPFKNSFNPTMIRSMGGYFKAAWPKFDRAGFEAMAIEGLEALELKQRSEHISLALEHFLPDDFALACDIIRASIPCDGGVEKEADVPSNHFDRQGGGIRGWGIMAINAFVARVGGADAQSFDVSHFDMSHFDISMRTLALTTQYFTSEFAVRTFILSDQDRAMTYFKNWSRDDNMHVRRLSSEGSRPRLPWGQQLPMFVADPAPTLALLEILKNDGTEYVRRSVANHLNDIAKDHPDRVADLAVHWLAEDGSKNRRRMVRHACRTLIKNGHGGALSAFGYSPPQLADIDINISTPFVKLGEVLQFETSLTNTADKPQSLMIDFIIHHVKANGKTSPKVFKWKTMTLPKAGCERIAKSHPMKLITTRKYYLGRHFLELQINGVVMGRAEFELVV